ncbi:MAG: hypothetical protein AAGC55_18985, partial [Myxococcota bacterium]
AEALRAAAPDTVASDEAEARAIMAADSARVAIVLTGTAREPSARILHQGFESTETLALLRVGADAMWSHLGQSERPVQHRIETLEPAPQAVPLGQAWLPVLFAIDVVLLGFMFGSVMLLQDKESGALGFYRATPGGAVHYIASKLLVNLGLIALNIAILVGLVAPHRLATPMMWLIMVVAGAGVTLLGLALAVFFRGLSSFFYPFALIGLVAATPLYAFVSPSIDAPWMQWIPTWPVLFGSEAALFGGDPAAIRSALLYLVPFTAIAGAACALAVRHRLLREVAS